jgi:glycine/D-amino acid oxidase-like deaminating enzyme
VKVCVVGSGIAGSLLAWRLAQRSVRVELLLGPTHHLDATAVSGGIVRGYEPDPVQRTLAVESLLELTAEPRLRAWSRYREVACTWAAADLGELRAAAVELAGRLPGSVELLDAAELTARGWHALPEAGGAIHERRAGWLRPDALRTAVLADLVRRRNVTVRPGSKPGAADATVIAAGAWTPGVLAALGLSARGLRTKAIQYSVHRTGSWRPGPFVDATTGLYGRPAPDGLLLGLPTEDWDVDPARTRVDASLVVRAAKLAAVRFPRLRLGPVIGQVSAGDCYAEPAVLALRRAGTATFTFTGGSGGAAKSALAASSRAAAALLHPSSQIGQAA